MNLDHDFFQVSKLSEDKKKGLHQKKKNFVPQILVETCAQMHTKVKFIGGMQMQTILKLLGGIHSHYWGNISPIHPCRWEDERKADKCIRNRFVGNNHQTRGTKQSLATHPPCTQYAYSIGTSPRLDNSFYYTWACISEWKSWFSVAYSSTGHGIKN